jgi:hypothetical protein
MTSHNLTIPRPFGGDSRQSVKATPFEAWDLSVDPGFSGKRSCQPRVSQSYRVGCTRRNAELHFGAHVNFAPNHQFIAYQFGALPHAGAGGLNPLYQIGGPRSAQLALKLIF